MANDLPTPELLRKLLRYDPDTGALLWRYRDNYQPQWNARYAGKAAFMGEGNGYRNGKIFGMSYLAHRVIWAMQTGAWPIAHIDHVDGDGVNNRWLNLREATRSENMRNCRSAKGSTSKYLGVGWRKDCEKWHAQIMADGKKKHLGSYDCEIEAAKAYDAAAIIYHGEFANLNLPEIRAFG